MSNVEIHGPGVMEAYRDQVDEALADCPFRDQVVTTTFASRCFSHPYKESPFIRIYDTNEKRIFQLIELLEPLGFSFEWVILDGFKPVQ